MAKLFVLSGGPGVGKTSLCRALARANFPVGEETWTFYQEHRTKNAAWNKMDATSREFYRLLYDIQMDCETKIQEESKGNVAFLDRSVHDIVAFADYYEVPVPLEVRMARRPLYEKVVFFPDMLPPEMFDKESCTYEQAMEIHVYLRNFYVQLGFTPVAVPFASIEQRMQFILQHINGPSLDFVVAPCDCTSPQQVDELVEKLLDVDEQAYKGWRRRDGRYNTILNDPQRGGAFCASMNNRIIGHLVFEHPTEETRLDKHINVPIGAIYVCTLVVLPEFQRHGVAKRLITSFANRFVGRDVFFNVRWDNLVALNLYLSLECSIELALKDRFGIGDHAFLMKANLSDCLSRKK